MRNKSAYIWGLLGRFTPQVIYLGTTMLLARLLTPTDFGMIGVLSVIFVVANTLLDAGLGGSLIKEKEISPIDCSSISAFNIVVSLIIYFLLFLLSNSLECFFEIDGLSPVIKTISLVFPISAFGIVPKALLNRDLQFKKTFFSALLGVSAASIISIIIAYKNGGVYALVAYQIINIAVTVIANFIASKYRLSIRFSINSFKKLLPFGLYTTVISTIDTIYENLITSLTGKFLNVTQSGYLYQAKRIEETLSSTLSTTINIVAFPILTKLKDDKTRFENEAASTFKIIVCISAPLLFFVASFSEYILALLFGKQWIDAASYLEALTFAGVFIVMESLIRNFIKSLNEVKRLLYMTVGKRVLGISLLLIAVKMSPDYLVYAYILTSFIGYMANLFLYTRITQSNTLQLFSKSFVYILPGLIMYIILKLPFMANCTLLLKTGAGLFLLLAIYFIVLRLLGIRIIDWIKCAISQ